MPDITLVNLNMLFMRYGEEVERELHVQNGDGAETQKTVGPPKEERTRAGGQPLSAGADTER